MLGDPTAERIVCTLPGGYIQDSGVISRRAVVTALTGHEEALLAGQTDRMSPALITRLLARCVERIGMLSPVTVDIIRELTIADRYYLLIRLREATFGAQIDATLVCPACQHKLDIQFTTHDIPTEEPVQRAVTYRMTLSPQAAYRDGECVHDVVVYRLPNGGDQEALMPLLIQDDDSAGRLLLSRCVQSIGDVAPITIDHINRLAPAAWEEIEAHMEQTAPEVALTMEIDCPECGHSFEMPFDIEGLLFSGLQTSLRRLRQEVHYLAFHYHWSENEIMSMARSKRRAYIATLSEEIEKMNNAY